MEKITKLHPVFLTFEGWVSTEGEVTVPENTMGGCPKCWSPVVVEDHASGGVCVCCGWTGTPEEVLYQESQMIYQIQYNSSKHLPGCARSFLDHWKSCRENNISTIVCDWIISNDVEFPAYIETLSNFINDSFEHRKEHLRELGILDSDGKLVADFGDLLSYLETNDYRWNGDFPNDEGKE